MRARPEHVGPVDDRHARARLLELVVEPPRVRALGQPQPTRPVAEALAVRLDAGAQLQPQAVGRREKGQHGMRRGRRPARVRRERGQQAAARERVRRGRVPRPLCPTRRHARVSSALEVERVRRRPDVAQEGEAAVERARRRELVAQHRRERERDAAGVVVEHVEQRQVARRDRLPQPLLAERPRPEALDVGHVGVEHDRQRSRAPAHGRSTASKSSARSSPPRRSAKSRTEIAGVKRS